MKEFNIYIALLIIVLISASGCEKFLEKQPDDMKTDAMIWSSRKETEAFLYNVYSQLPLKDFHRSDPWLGVSDEADLTWNVHPTYQINLGNWNSSTNYYNKWTPYYKAIRASYIFEDNVDKNHELSPELKAQYKAEVKFLRAYYYWLLLKQYGPVVLLKKVMPLDTDWAIIPRSTYDECVIYITDLLDEAEAGLPLHWQSDKQWLGKPNKVVCKAVKAEVLTMAASPQWNGNADYANFKNNDGTQLTNLSYDETKWKTAADASYAVIKIAEENPDVNIKLYKNHENGDGTEFSAFKSLKDVHIKRWNPEIVWGRAGTSQSSYEIHVSPGPNNLGGVAPTQRVVDAFLMKNGRSITDPLSGYIEEGFATAGGSEWNPKGYNITTDRVKMINDIRDGNVWGHWPGDWNMYANREPRFYVSILYNKRIIPQLPTDAAKRNYYNINSQQNGYGRVEFYYGGLSRQSGSYTFYPRTGYLVLKNVDYQSDMRDRVVAENRTEIVIRYAKVLLDYIEALNEYNPNHPDIAKYWDMIRERAGVPGIFTVYPEIRGDKELQRNHILTERQIELAFEGDRYVTTRRRWLAHTPDNGDPMRKFGEGGKMWGMDINGGSPTANNFNYVGFYKRVPFEERVYSMKMNLFPILQSEIDKNSALVQNPGW